MQRPSSMMAYMAAQITDIADMPRGGPDASWLDRLLETDRPEYLDRDDVDDGVKRGIVRRWTGSGPCSANTTATPNWCCAKSPTSPIPRSSNSARATARCPARCSNSIPLRTSRSLTSTPSRSRRSRPSDLGEPPARDGAHRSTRPRSMLPTALRPGGVRAVLPPPTARSGGTGVRRRHPGGRSAADHRSAPAAVAAAPRELAYGAVRAVVAVRPRRVHQFAARLQSLGAAGAGRARRPRRRRQHQPVRPAGGGGPAPR